MNSCQKDVNVSGWMNICWMDVKVSGDEFLMSPARRRRIASEEEQEESWMEGHLSDGCRWRVMNFHVYID